MDVTIEAICTGKRAVETDAATLVAHNIDDVRGNLTLPAEGENGTTITWRSAKPDTLGETGEVNRPAPGAKAVRVNLKATISRGGHQAVRIFKPEVPALPAEEPYKGYLFACFTGEGYSDGEQIYNALSKGDDPLHWQELNGGRPVVTSGVGEKGLRDPFVIRSPEGDRFYLIATDLKIYGNATGTARSAAAAARSWWPSRPAWCTGRTSGWSRSSRRRQATPGRRRRTTTRPSGRTSCSGRPSRTATRGTRGTPTTRWCTRRPATSTPSPSRRTSRPRHGTVLGVTQAEYDRLLSSLG
ncbi:immunoglobulin-like domain-containing protein [Microbispora sp. NPDC049633]|uniref:immunoglobulin-like domain-containing protein n=1 Tax=Microbispora sp. NPDC049633 TaxID=3154355 RepID=UPI00343BA269